jgi:hypothetical protein
MTDTNTPTPRTDAALKAWGKMTSCYTFDDFADFARTLERELAQANAVIDEICHLHGCTAEFVVLWCKYDADLRAAIDAARKDTP